MLMREMLIGEANNTKKRLYTILEKSKETILETAKISVIGINGWIQ